MRPGLLGCAGAVLLALPGCGGDDPLSDGAFRDRANTICRDLQAANERQLEDIDPDDRAALADATEAVGRRTQEALSQLGDLDGPEEAEAELDRFLASARAFGEQVEGADAAELERLADEVAQQARAAGLDACAE